MHKIAGYQYVAHWKNILLLHQRMVRIQKVSFLGPIAIPRLKVPNITSKKEIQNQDNLFGIVQETGV